MLRKKPTHLDVPGPNPNGWNGAANKISVKVICNTKVNGVPLQIWFDIAYQIEGVNSASKHNMFFTIPQDCIIEFRLDNSCNGILDWSEEFEPLTAKDSHGGHYGGYLYDRNTKVITMTAKKRNGNWVKDGFNLNVDLNQGPGTDPETGVSKVINLPVTLDPDVINPRPPGLFNLEPLDDGSRLQKLVFEDTDGGKEEVLVLI